MVSLSAILKLPVTYKFVEFGIHKSLDWSFKPLFKG